MSLTFSDSLTLGKPERKCANNPKKSRPSNLPKPEPSPRNLDRVCNSEDIVMISGHQGALSTAEARRRLRSWKRTTIVRKCSQQQ